MTWPATKLKWAATTIAGGTPSVSEPSYWAENGDTNGLDWVSISDMSGRPSVTATGRRVSLEGTRAARLPIGDAGTLIMSMYASLGHTAFLTRRASWNQAILGIIPSVTYDSHFLKYALEAIKPTLREIARSNTQANLNAEQVGNLAIPNPPPGEQRRIADFLDTETTRIDQLSTSRRRQISALDERELAVIAEMLAGGATQDNGQPTGWPWLPHIPTDWKIGPVYAYYLTELGKMLNSDRASGDRQLPYLRNANVHWHEIDSSDMATMHFDPAEAQRYSVKAGDLLVCEGGAGVAEAAVWDGRIDECYFQKSLHRVRQDGPLPVEWLMFWLRFAKSCGVFEADGNIATIPHLTGEQLREYRIPIPSDAQDRVAKTVRALTAMGDARAHLKQAQALLAERRQALITAAVTGQFDVSTASGRNVTDGVHA
ncbi:restriction endonuclease subunit S [[Kitasatospora] papulosa]|uniref:restriction endonuclease subunit S n=1 Tax=[Kitasatospora] papulosa TaxID=1464011 RepID=UPI0036B44E11